EPGGDGRGGPAAVRLERSHRDQRVRALFEGLAHQELELPHLVPALGEAGEVVPLDVQLDPQLAAKTRQRLDRGRAGPEAHAAGQARGHDGPTIARGVERLEIRRAETPRARGHDPGPARSAGGFPEPTGRPAPSGPAPTRRPGSAAAPSSSSTPAGEPRTP